MSKPSDVPKDIQIAIRIESDVAARADALIAPLSALPEFQAFRMSRAAVLRMALLEGLTQLEEKYGKAAGRKR